FRITPGKVWKMRYLSIPVTLFIVANACAQEPAPYAGPKDKLHVYILVGQSNMSGRARVEAEDQNIPKNLYLLDGKGDWGPATPRSVQNPTARNGPEGGVKRGGGRVGLTLGWGFARRMLEANPGIAVGLVVNPQGGSALASWKKGAKGSNYDRT